VKILKLTSKDWWVHLECVCADDFGSSYKDQDDRTEDDYENINNYEATREAHQRLQELAEQQEVRNYIADTNDGTSLHSDAYLYFWWSDLKKIDLILKQSGVLGDVLDIDPSFPVSLREQAKKRGWSVEITL